MLDLLKSTLLITSLAFIPATYAAGDDDHDNPGRAVAQAYNIKSLQQLCWECIFETQGRLTLLPHQYSLISTIKDNGLLDNGGVLSIENPELSDIPEWLRKYQDSPESTFTVIHTYNQSLLVIDGLDMYQGLHWPVECHWDAPSPSSFPLYCPDLFTQSSLREPAINHYRLKPVV